MKRKWKDSRGETLVEVLAAILIGTLSVALLFSAVMASSNMDKIAREADKAHSAILEKAEGRTAVGAVSSSKVKVKKSGGSFEEEVPVEFYGGKGAWSFALPTPP